MNDLIPRLPRKKRQPTAEMLREQLRLAADEIISLRSSIDTVKRLNGWDRPPQREPWWSKVFPFRIKK